MEDESRLIQRSQQGEFDAFNQLVERYQGHVYNLALRMLSDRGLAEDAAQETFVSAFRAIGGFRGGSFRSWVLRIAANNCRDLLRSAKVRRSVSLDDLELTPGSTLTSREESPEDHALRLELGREIQRGLEALSHDHRLVLALIDIQGFSYEEAARVTQTSVGTVKSRLSRARGQLRHLLRQRPELLPSRFRLET